MLAVLGQVADAVPGGLGRVGDLTRLPPQRDHAAAGPVGTDQRAGDLGAACAHQPGEAEDLALQQVERDVLQQLLGAESFDAEQDLSVLTDALRLRLALIVRPTIREMTSFMSVVLVSRVST